MGPVYIVVKFFVAVKSLRVGGKGYYFSGVLWEEAMSYGKGDMGGVCG